MIFEKLDIMFADILFIFFKFWLSEKKQDIYRESLIAIAKNHKSYIVFLDA
jgi:hypothetical protein